MALKISFKAEAQTDKNGEGVTHKLYIYDPVHGGYDIDPESWEFHTSETSAAYFRKALEAVSKSDTIEVHINSAGGSVKEGLAIANQLAAHPARKVAYVDGFNCSVCTAISSACDQVVMPKSAVTYVHHAWDSVAGNAAQLRSAADALDTIDTAFRAAILRHAGERMTEERLVELMDANGYEGTWLTAEQCIECGLADELAAYDIDPQEAKRIVLDGSEMWAEYTDENWQGAGYHVYRFYNADALISQYIASNKYPSRRGASNFKGTLGVTSGAQSILFSVVEQKTVDDWKAYLAAQKAAGTPLIIYRQSTAYDGTNGLDVCLMKYQTGFVELDGTEASHIFDGMFYLDYSAAWPTPANRVNGVCSHYPYGTYGKGKIGLTDNGAAVAYNPNSDYTGDEGGLANWKAYLAAQKEAGTPVQVAYQLAAPEVYATDPVDIQKAAGLSISSGAVTTEIKEGQKLVVRSEADRLEIAIYTTENEWVEDVYQQSDFSTARFIYAPPGDSTLKFSHEGSQELNVSVEVRAYYEAV